MSFVLNLWRVLLFPLCCLSFCFSAPQNGRGVDTIYSPSTTGSDITCAIFVELKDSIFLDFIIHQYRWYFLFGGIFCEYCNFFPHRSSSLSSPWRHISWFFFFRSRVLLWRDLHCRHCLKAPTAASSVVVPEEMTTATFPFPGQNHSVPRSATATTFAVGRRPPTAAPTSRFFAFKVSHMVSIQDSAVLRWFCSAN